MLNKKTILFAFLICLQFQAYAAAPRDYYVIQIYHCSSQKQINNIDLYLKNTYLPFLHQTGIKKVGVFAPLANDTALDKKLYVWVPLKTLNQLDKLDQAIEKLDPMGDDPLIHLEMADSSAPYTRIEKIITKSFKYTPNYQKKSELTVSPDRIFEYRSYESLNENLHLKKVHMFNEGDEIGVFTRNHFNAIFYSKVIAGARMPNMIYMTSFNNIADRDAHWKAFSKDPVTKKIFALPEYQKTVTTNETVLMKARDYADF
jgi:hypothetical protein